MPAAPTDRKSTMLPWLPWLVLLASCSTPPKPPTVDENNRRPVNTAATVELQVCRNDLANTRILATESGRLAEHTSAALQRMATQQQMLAAMQATVNAARVQEQLPASAQSQPATPPAANAVYTLHFAFGSSEVQMPAATRAALLEDVRHAPLVLLRGRTDGVVESPGESRIARERALAVRDHLVAAGVDPARIRLTWQPVGDHLADNSQPGGRDLNRRVEIEVYRALPVAGGGSTSVGAVRTGAL